MKGERLFPPCSEGAIALIALALDAGPDGIAVVE